MTRVALLRCDFFAETLGLGTSMTVLLPQPSAGQIGVSGGGVRPDPPVLYLLHGLSDDDTAWTRYTSIERYVEPLGLAVVMPQVHRSFYADEATGHRFWTFLSTELPELVHRFFRVSTRREDTFVAGLSMGGYGAFKWALREPHRFAAAASLSGALDIADRSRRGDWNEDPPVMARVFADRPVAGTPDDLLWLLDRADPAGLPALYQYCGTEDALYRENIAFRDTCSAKGIPLKVHFGPGDHQWSYWDSEIRAVLDWLPIR